MMGLAATVASDTLFNSQVPIAKLPVVQETTPLFLAPQKQRLPGLMQHSGA